MFIHRYQAVRWSVPTSDAAAAKVRRHRIDVASCSQRRSIVDPTDDYTPQLADDRLAGLLRVRLVGTLRVRLHFIVCLRLRRP